jgi:hypothetical protein
MKTRHAVTQRPAAHELLMDALDQERVHDERRAESLTDSSIERLVRDARAGLDEHYEIAVSHAHDLLAAVGEPRKRGDAALVVSSTSPRERNDEGAVVVAALRVAAHVHGLEAWAAPHPDACRALLGIGAGRRVVAVVLLRRG